MKELDNMALTHNQFKILNALSTTSGATQRELSTMTNMGIATVNAALKERPKGLLKVRGEVLIERQIEQLKAAGVNDIIIVVGYKKESFFYLEDKYGVKIVVNRAYAERNNNSSLMLVREILGNTYICSSDNYFENNPFERYA